MAHIEQRRGEGGAIKYGDVFEMSGEMAEQPISPRDAAAMRSAETSAFGKTIKGGPASIMLQAAAKNLQAGLVGPDDHAFSSDQPLVEGNHWHESQPSHEQMGSGSAGVTIGEALEAAAEAVRDKPVDQSDVASIRATGTNPALGSGLGAEAQVAFEGGSGADSLRHRGVKQSTTPGGVAEAVEAAARINEPDK